MACFDIDRGDLVALPESEAPPTDAPSPLARHIHALFRALMLSPTFPCLGGAGAVRCADYRFGLYDRMDDAGSIAEVARDLDRFLRDRPADANPVSVHVAAFAHDAPATEAAFEAALWTHLDRLKATGPASTMTAPDLVDPTDPGFVFMDREFFVVGLHPAASRWARRFGWPVLVFNALTHASALAADDRHGRLSRAILARDRALQGSDNPSLGASQKAQFSGRAVPSDWRRPDRTGGA